MASAAVEKAIGFVSFVFGGAAYAVRFGFLAAGVSVTSYFSRLLPRWLIALGIAVAIAGEFSSLSLVTYPANFLIPITRYLGFIWLLLTAVKLTMSRLPEQASRTAEVSERRHQTELPALCSRP